MQQIRTISLLFIIVDAHIVIIIVIMDDSLTQQIKFPNRSLNIVYQRRCFWTGHFGKGADKPTTLSRLLETHKVKIEACSNYIGDKCAQVALTEGVAAVSGLASRPQISFT